MSARLRAPFRRAIELAVWIIVVGIWAVTLRPTSLGGPATYVVVRGDSMLPTFHSGDLVILHASAAYGSGDIVGYRVPDGEVGEGHLVVHRIVSGDGQGGFTLLGDNNPAPDPWRPSSGDVAGQAWLLLPGVGRVVALVQQPAVAGALAASLVVMLGLLWQPSRRGRRRDDPLDGGQPVVSASGAQRSA